MKHPLTDGVGPGEWVDDSKERRLVSLAEKRLVEAVARIAELEAALLTVREAFDDDAGMAILIDRVLSSAARPTPQDTKDNTDV